MGVITQQTITMYYTMCYIYMLYIISITLHPVAVLPL